MDNSTGNPLLPQMHRLLLWALTTPHPPIQMVCPLPPPLARCFTVQAGRIKKSGLYRDYCNSFSQKVTDRNLHLLKLPDGIYDPKAWYVISVKFYFERLAKKRKSGGPSVFLRLDVDNRFKALFDSLTAFTGIDDANFKLIVAEKEVDPEDPRAEVEIRRLL